MIKVAVDTRFVCPSWEGMNLRNCFFRVSHGGLPLMGGDESRGHMYNTERELFAPHGRG